MASRDHTFAELQADAARNQHGFALLERAIEDTMRLEMVFPETSDDLALHRARLRYALSLLRDVQPVPTPLT